MTPWLHSILSREDPRNKKLARSALVDEAMERYVEWREECVSVDDAYTNWSGTPPEEAELPFAAYTAALDREQSAATVYRRAIDRLARVV